MNEMCKPEDLRPGPFSIRQTRTICFFQIAIKVKALIDAGTCSSVSTLSYCGSASQAYAYYETFAYKTFRVVIISGVPSHNAEYSQTQANPNVRCKYGFETIMLDSYFRKVSCF